MVASQRFEPMVAGKATKGSPARSFRATSGTAANANANVIGAAQAKTAMSVMLGNAWNDLVQPFWILPALALSKLKLKDIMGYTVIVMFWVGIIHIAAILLWGYLG